MLRRLLALLAFAAAVAFAQSPALAHGTHGHSHGEGHDESPMHGGDMQHVGEYHLELVVEEGRLVAYLTDAHAEELSADGFGLGGLVLTGGQQLDVTFVHDGGSRLVAEGSFEATPDLRAVLTLMAPNGESHRARFQPVQ